jgi:2-dehydro-3-deoxygluconokinase
MAGLTLRADDCALDFLSLGALVHRLDPGTMPFRRARSFDVHVSGGEYNVAAALSDCFRLRAGICTAMARYPIGELVQRAVREAGVTPFYRWYDNDGVRGPNIATVYSDRGAGVRGPVVFYNRANEAAALLRPGDFDWGAIHAGGVRWFHSGGIFASLGPHTADLILEGMQAAHAAGAVTSFDLNYRPKLWASVGGASRAQEVLSRIASHVDVLIGNEEDLQKGLGIRGPDLARPGKGGLDPEVFFRMIEVAVDQFPNIKMVATTLREVHSANRHDWAAVLWADGEELVSPRCQLDVVDRIGGGDGFASGLIYGLLSKRPLEEALKLGWAHGALLTTFAGDVTMASLEEVQAFGSQRVVR